MLTVKKSPAEWRKLAGLLALVLLAGTPLAVFFSMTVGLITGLVVLFVPLYVLAAWQIVTAVSVSLCLWRQWFVAARVVGCACLLGPASGVALWYWRKYDACQKSDDVAKCLAYLNGSPLLPFFVGVVVLVALVASGAVLWIVHNAQRDSGETTANPSPNH